MRKYSDSSVPARVFVDILNAIGCHGWRRAGPVDETEFDRAPIVVFRVSDDCGKRASHVFQAGLKVYVGETDWSLSERGEGQFLLCPMRLFNSVDGVDAKLADSLRQSDPDFVKKANSDLFLLADAMYQIALAEGLVEEKAG